jgi:hypothetical protein
MPNSSQVKPYTRRDKASSTTTPYCLTVLYKLRLPALVGLLSDNTTSCEIIPILKENATICCDLIKSVKIKRMRFCYTEITGLTNASRLCLRYL